MISIRYKIIILFLFSIFLIMASLLFGTQFITPSQLFSLLKNDHCLISCTIIGQIRLPRVLSAYLSGSLLALSGLLMQIMLENPLADPFILGISGGGSVIMLALTFFGASQIFIELGGWMGSFVAFLLIWFIGFRKKFVPSQLLLIGVMFSFLWSAMISFILTVSSDNTLKSMIFWMLGDLNEAQISYYQPTILIAALIFCLYYAKDLEVLVLGHLIDVRQV